MNLPDSPAILQGMVMRKDEQIAELVAALNECSWQFALHAGVSGVLNDAGMRALNQAKDLSEKHEAAHG